jgi:hypothetical protein
VDLRNHQRRDFLRWSAATGLEEVIQLGSHPSGIELAQSALRHPDFDDAWLTDVPVDHECRPLVKWVEGVTWTRTDLAALSEAQAEQRRAERLRIEQELATLRRQRLATL